jgi:hypothetical protein
VQIPKEIIFGEKKHQKRKCLIPKSYLNSLNNDFNLGLRIIVFLCFAILPNSFPQLSYVRIIKIWKQSDPSEALITTKLHKITRFD